MSQDDAMTNLLCGTCRRSPASCPGQPAGFDRCSKYLRDQDRVDASVRVAWWQNNQPVAEIEGD